MSASLVISLILLAIFVAVAVCLALEGLWTSLVTVLNVLLAASMATAWHGVVAAFLERFLPSFTYLLDLLSLWGLFALILLVLREATDRISRTKVRFPPLAERFGSPVAAMIAAWIVVCFAAASLHVAPVPRDVVQESPDDRMLFGLAPDRKWLQFVRGSSANGPFGRPADRFDAKADFIVRHAQRRWELEKEEGLRVSR